MFVDLQNGRNLKLKCRENCVIDIEDIKWINSDKNSISIRFKTGHTYFYGYVSKDDMLEDFNKIIKLKKKGGYGKMAKEGDKVRILQGCTGTIKGEIYTLRKDTDGNLCAGKCICTTKWELVEKGGDKNMEFEVGMLVRCTNTHKAGLNAYVFEKDKIYYIVAKDGSAHPLKFVEKGNVNNGGWGTSEYFEPLIEEEKNKGGLKMETLKAYFKKHSETFITLGIIILVDEYLFGGALREKIKALLDKMLGQTAKKLTTE